MNISQLYDIYLSYPLISTDTRKCHKDSIFFALKGANFNGNKFAKEALNKGCKYAIVDEAEYANQPNIILVDNCLTTLQQLANYHRKTLKIPIIGITGTNGKTTTKELMTSVLRKEYNVLATEGNLNNDIGVPMTVLKITKDHELAIIEMGASHMKEIKLLTEIAEPNFGIITNIGYAHLEGFGSFENIIKAKSELYDFVRTVHEGKLFIDYENELLRNLAEGITPIYYGIEDGLFVSGKVTSINPYLEFDWNFASTSHHVRTKLIGAYNLTNALAAITVGKYFGVRTELINQALEEYQPTNNRSQLKETDSNMLVIDAYNANPTSMMAALRNFDEMDVNRKVLILGDMKELGPDTDVEHQKIADFVSKHFEQAFFVGDYFNGINTKFPKYKNFEELSSYLKENPIKDSYVLIKGSRGGKLERFIDIL